MYKKKLTAITILFLLFVGSWAQERPGFYVEGRHLYDQCGEKVILRGVANPNIWFERDGLAQYQEIEKTGANVVRIVWDTTGTAAQLDAAILNCINLKMIPMIECHDATCKLDLLNEVVDYWTRTDIIEVIQEHEEYLLLNIANEAGDWATSASAFRTAYESAILRIREADIHVPLVIDATDCGKKIDVLQSEGPYLIGIDPDSNLIFSIHMWWNTKTGYPESKISQEIEQSVNMGLPLIVGEFANWFDWEDDEITPETIVPYRTIIKQCHLNEVGYIVWSWFGNNIPIIDMTTNGTYETLRGWGLEVAVTDSYSIANTSVRPYSIVNGKCKPNAVEGNINSIHPEGFELKQNFPNPFNPSTRIPYSISSSGFVTIKVYDILGVKIQTLVNKFQNTGTYYVNFDGRKFSNGIYFYKLKAGNFVQTRKMILLM